MARGQHEGTFDMPVIRRRLLLPFTMVRSAWWVPIACTPLVVADIGCHQVEVGPVHLTH
jgi:hypothetical protein